MVRRDRAQAEAEAFGRRTVKCAGKHCTTRIAAAFVKQGRTLCSSCYRKMLEQPRERV